MSSNVEGVYYKSKHISLLILAATAIVSSHALFFLFQDAEGPNLLIVTVFALALFLLSSAAYLFIPSKTNGITRIIAAIGLQILLMAVLYFCMK